MRVPETLWENPDRPHRVLFLARECSRPDQGWDSPVYAYALVEIGPHRKWPEHMRYTHMELLSLDDRLQFIPVSDEFIESIDEFDRLRDTIYSEQVWLTPGDEIPE